MKAIHLSLKTTATGGGIPSDTLFGAICWGYRFVEGQEALQECLREFEEGHPPFLISGLFPYYEFEGRKVHFFPAEHLSLGKRLVGESRASEKEISDLSRDIDKISWVPNELLEDLEKSLLGFCSDEGPSWARTCEKCDGEIFNAGEVEYVLAGDALVHHELLHDDRKRLDVAAKEKRLLEPHESPHNVLNRLSWSVEEGLLFFRNEFGPKLAHGLYFLSRGNSKVVETSLRFLEERGIGGDVASGKGAFKVEGIEGIDLKERDSGAHEYFVTLSHYLPRPQEVDALCDPLARYSLEVRRGAVESSFVDRGDVWKDALRMVSPGSILPWPSNAKWLGRNHIEERFGMKVHHYGFAFPYPISGIVLQEVDKSG